jgi:hypothetical protein
VTTSDQSIPHFDAAPPQERQSVACVSPHMPGPMLTLISTAVASGHLIAVKGRGWATSGAGHSTARADWNGTSAPPSQNAKSAGLAKAPRLQIRQLRSSFRVIQAPRQQGFSFGSHRLSDTPQASTALRVRLPVVLNGSQDQRQRIAEVSVGGFHLVFNPSVPVIQQ